MGYCFWLWKLPEIGFGWIPGFYTLIIFATIYLMLPMFEGSNKIFREVLVQIAGLQEMLLLHDAIKIKHEMLKDFSPERAKLVRASIAKFYAADDGNADDGNTNSEAYRMFAWPFFESISEKHKQEQGFIDAIRND